MARQSVPEPWRPKLTFTFLYAWNSFIWPLVIINVGNEKNHVLTLRPQRPARTRLGYSPI
jgi:ABC-type glycerol-3-phosphate transport system permease component